MKNLRIRKTLATLAMASLTLVTVNEIAPEPIYYTNYTINQSYDKKSDELTPYAKCFDKDVYIGKERQLEKLDDKIKRRSILIVDERKSNDPNMRIINSKNIKGKSNMASIACIMQEYNDEYPSKWDRSNSSIINEWEIHNICSYISFMPSHTDEVDLNNNDEILYRSKILSKVLR